MLSIEAIKNSSLSVLKCITTRKRVQDVQKETNLDILLVGWGAPVRLETATTVTTRSTTGIGWDWSNIFNTANL